MGLPGSGAAQRLQHPHRPAGGSSSFKAPPLLAAFGLTGSALAPESPRWSGSDQQTKNPGEPGLVGYGSSGFCADSSERLKTLMNLFITASGRSFKGQVKAMRFGPIFWRWFREDTICRSTDLLDSSDRQGFLQQNRQNRPFVQQNGKLR